MFTNAIRLEKKNYRNIFRYKRQKRESVKIHYYAILLCFDNNRPTVTRLTRIIVIYKNVELFECDKTLKIYVIRGCLNCVRKREEEKTLKISSDNFYMRFVKATSLAFNTRKRKRLILNCKTLYVLLIEESSSYMVFNEIIVLRVKRH